MTVTKLAPEYILEDRWYTAVVIERVKEGLTAIPKEWWYKWIGTEEKGKYIPWEKPARYRHVVCFAMG